MFIVKKLVGRLFFPLSLVIGLLLLGVLLKKSRKKLLLAGMLLLYLFSFEPFTYLLLRPLESRYGPVAESRVNKEVRWIVVLSGGSRSDQTLTPEDRLGDASLKRLLEGLRLARLLPQARLVLSGGDYRGVAPDAPAMLQVALAQGLRRERILLEAASWDTSDQAKYLHATLGRAPFYLVTSASHMPRSMGMFRRLGTQPLAAPTDFHALWTPFTALDLFPQAASLAATERAFNEYLGLMWSLLRGHI